jgi:hypothetical protein
VPEDRRVLLEVFKENIMKVFLIALFALTFSVCAIAEDKNTVSDNNIAAQQKSFDPSAESYYSEIDWEYVNKVEKLAARRGVAVKWVNMPLKKRPQVAAKQ